MRMATSPRLEPNTWIYGKANERNIIMTPLYDSEAELYSLFDKLMRREEENHSNGEVSVYDFMRICGSRTPSGYSEYNYNIILSSCMVGTTKVGNKRWWAKFILVKRRSSWMLDSAYRNTSQFYET